MKQNFSVLVVGLLLASLTYCCDSPAWALPATGGLPRLVDKPLDDQPVQRAREQPTVPSNYTEVPFVETIEKPSLTPSEKLRGYLLFKRPITEPVYANTRPRSEERLQRLIAFATPGEFEPVTLSLYPERGLKNLRVRVSSLEGPGGIIPAEEITTRLVTYWNIGFPAYTSRETYRLQPELLESVTVHTSPAGECQRWWIRIHVPENAKPGLFQGTVTVWDDKSIQATEIPLTLRVLGFPLKRDPAKHTSAYYYNRNRVQLRGKDEAFIKKAIGNEYQAMVDYGLDMLPTFDVRLDSDSKRIVLRGAEELPRMLAAGLKGPLPIQAGSVIARIYRETTPDGKRGPHWQVSKMPPRAFYDRITVMFRAFKQECQAKGWPPLVCVPIDEVSASHKEFGSRVYQAVHAAGVRTYITKNPRAYDAEPYRPYVDAWCSQPYSVPYKRIVGQNQYEYWCYPNHNAGERKDRRTMCKGGRMTYGFGFWRSGYTTLIPWHWAWTPEPDQFDYLRGSHSGCGQRIDDNGEVIPAVYWECFREGQDDARYLYTLQQAVWERQTTRDPVCLNQVEQAKKLLQETWDAIVVQEKYLASGMWDSTDFNARRWQLALAIEKLLAFPAARQGQAPSVLVANPTEKKKTLQTASVEQSIIKAADQGLLEIKDLTDQFAFTNWKNLTKEGAMNVTRDAGLDGKAGARWRVEIDHKLSGESDEKYLVGWPRVERKFGKDELDLSEQDYLELQIRVDSNRDEVADDRTPLGLLIGSPGNHDLFDVDCDLGDRQRTWIPLRFSIREMMKNTEGGAEPWQNVSRIQWFVKESDYRDGDQLTFDVGAIRLLRFKQPMLMQVDVPRVVLLPSKSLVITFALAGTRTVAPGTHRINAFLRNSEGKILSKLEQDLAANGLLNLDISQVEPGRYQLSVVIRSANGKLCSESGLEIQCVAGPAWEGIGLAAPRYNRPPQPVYRQASMELSSVKLRETEN